MEIVGSTLWAIEDKDILHSGFWVLLLQLWHSSLSGNATTSPKRHQDADTLKAKRPNSEKPRQGRIKAKKSMKSNNKRGKIFKIRWFQVRSL